MPLAAPDAATVVASAAGTDSSLDLDLDLDAGADAFVPEAHPDTDPASVRFTDLYEWVMKLEGFADDPKRCGEKVLEAIQAAWIAEAD